MARRVTAMIRPQRPVVGTALLPLPLNPAGTLLFKTLAGVILDRRRRAANPMLGPGVASITDPALER